MKNQEEQYWPNRIAAELLWSRNGKSKTHQIARNLRYNYYEYSICYRNDF